MATITLVVEDRKIYQSHTGNSVSGTAYADTVNFVLDDEWSDITKTVTFYNKYFAVVLDYPEDDSINVPYEAEQTGGFYVTIAGTSDNKRILTAEMSEPVPVLKSGLYEGTTPSPVTEDIIEKCKQATIDALAAKVAAEEAAGDADIATEKANKATENANTATTNANTATTNANTAAADARAAIGWMTVVDGKLCYIYTKED